MNALNINRHPMDRIALIAGIMFAFAGFAYLLDDHGIVNVTEGAVAGTIVIVVGLVLLLAAVIDSPEALPARADADLDAPLGSSVDDQADFSWSNSSSTNQGAVDTDTPSSFDEAE